MRQNFLLRCFISLCMLVMAVNGIAQTAPLKALPNKEVSGLITDSAGAPLPGVTVYVKENKKIGTTTDFKGRYILEVPDNATLVFGMVGFEVQEWPVSGKKTINIKLMPATNQLGETVVVAFGKQKKSELVGSETVINPSELKIPSSNLTAALAGKMAGIIAFQRSGEPGKDNADFFIRGVTTFGYKKDPLILIDNIEVTSDELARLQPDDIASFAIMKDATATALYGSRAANGVILITTKEGKEGPVKWTFRVENSWSQNTQNIKIADPITYMKLANEAVLTRNPLGSLPYSQNKIDNTLAGNDPILYPTDNWMQQLIKPVTTTQRANLNVNGGGKVAQYYISGSYNMDNGILKVDHRNNFNSNVKFKTYQLRSNININLTKTMEIVARLSGLFDDYTGPIDGGSLTFEKILGSNPVLFPAYYPSNILPFANHILFGNSSEGITTDANGQARPGYINPYADMVKGYQNSSSSNMSAQFEVRQDLSFITPGLSVRALFNTTRYSSFAVSRFYNPYYYEVAGYDKETKTYNLNLLNEASATNYLNYNEGGDDINTMTYYEAAVDYKRQFDKSNITGMLVGTRRNQLFANQGTLEKSLPYRNESVSGRLTYSYDDRYIAEFNFGYNGSERFDKNHRFGFFPSVGVAYNISKENFWDPIKETISSLKLRATYGLVGNDAIGSADDRFFYLSQVNMNDAARQVQFGTNYDYSHNGITINRYANSDITWETARKLNFGMDISLFNNLNITAEYYIQQRENILMDRAYIPVEMGFSAPVRANMGKAKGTGVDISADYSMVSMHNWWMKMEGNFTYAHDVYVYYSEPGYPANEKYLQHAGEPIAQQWGFIAERLFIDDKDVANSPKQNFGEYGAGDIKYRDVNGDGQITDLDKVPIGYPTTPEIIYGAGLSTGYKAFDLSFFFQGSARSSFWIDPAKTAPFIPNPDLGAGSQNELLQVYADNHWSEDNRNSYALWPRLSPVANSNDSQLSTWFMRNGAFLRLKSVELGYSLPANLLKRGGIRSMRIYVNSLNLLCFSRFKLWDVEMGGDGLGYPIQRVFNTGILVGF